MSYKGRALQIKKNGTSHFSREKGVAKGTGDGWELLETKRSWRQEKTSHGGAGGGTSKLRAEPEPRRGEGERRGHAGALPRSRLEASRLHSMPHDTPGKHREEIARPEEAAPPKTPEPQPRPGGRPHLAQLSSQTLAVELHPQATSGALGLHDPSPWTFFSTGLTAAAEDQTFRKVQGPAPSQTRKSNCFQRPRLIGSSAGVKPPASPPNAIRNAVAKGPSTQPGGRKLGDICEERTRKDPKNSKASGSSSPCFGRVSRRMC